MGKQLCIHGHFYQPPREDPWLDEVLPEASAAPARDWNERICRESYAPLAWSRRMDGQGRMIELFNAYEFISFNAGPTLMKWMEHNAPSAYARILAGDKASVARLGHGNALAQVCHHVIMPLASPLDKEVETAWAVEDFRARFGRAPEGMWLSEAAVDTPTLEVLAAHNIRFVVLAPRQAQAVAGPDGKDWHGVDEGGLDISQAYRIDLPSGASIAAFFYNGPISTAVAFERLLEDGENFWRRITGGHSDGLLALATDGETYGHHFKFGEMALAYVLTQAREGRDNFGLTNFASFLAANPPRLRVRLWEPSSWSCFHGVERWRADCGCSTGGHDGWNQKWRGPLRQALNQVKFSLDTHFFNQGAALFRDPKAALLDYGRLLAGTVTPEAFAEDHLTPGLDQSAHNDAHKLLAMQHWALASFASCAWFFDDIARIEPMNAMTFALRAMDLAKDTGGPDLENAFADILAKAWSNDTEAGNGRDIFRRDILPRRGTPASLAAQALLTLRAEDRIPAVGREAEVAWTGVSVRVAVTGREGNGNGQAIWGHIGLRWRNIPGEEPFDFRFASRRGQSALDSTLTISRAGQVSEIIYPCRSLPENKIRLLAWNFALAVDDALWHERLAAAIAGAALLTPWREGQNDQLAAPQLMPLWAPLCFAYACGQIDNGQNSGLLPFLQKYLPDNPEVPALLSRLSAEALAALAQPEPSWSALTNMVRRVAEIGLPLDWWEVRNTMWQKGFASPAARDTAAALGFHI